MVAYTRARDPSRRGGEREGREGGGREGRKKRIERRRFRARALLYLALPRSAVSIRSLQSRLAPQAGKALARYSLLLSSRASLVVLRRLNSRDAPLIDTPAGKTVSAGKTGLPLLFPRRDVPRAIAWCVANRRIANERFRESAGTPRYDSILSTSDTRSF